MLFVVAGNMCSIIIEIKNDTTCLIHQGSTNLGANSARAQALLK
jgi:hypothetical protein